MQYMGGKCLISNEIASIINPFTWGGAVWDGLNEEFFEIESKHYICDEDIAEWWENEE